MTTTQKLQKLNHMYPHKAMECPYNYFVCNINILKNLMSEAYFIDYFETGDNKVNKLDHAWNVSRRLRIEFRLINGKS